MANIQEQKNKTDIDFYELVHSGKLEKWAVEYSKIVKKISKDEFTKWNESGELPSIALTSQEMEFLKGGSAWGDLCYKVGKFFNDAYHKKVDNTDPFIWYP